MVNKNSFQFGAVNSQDILSRKMIITAFLAVALIAFEIFNFDTTKFALHNLLGDVKFAGVLWASILAIAFCSIDFAGLVRIFTPQKGLEESRAVLFMTGAWFLGTIANSVTTWWAVSLTLLSHEFGNEVLSREMLLRYVPIFVAMLVWLTRILFIGAFSVAGGDVFELTRSQPGNKPAATPRPDLPVGAPVRAASAQPASYQAATQPAVQARNPQHQTRQYPSPSERSTITYEPVDEPIVGQPTMPRTNGGAPSHSTSRIQQRPPMPGMGHSPTAGPVQARSSKPGH